MSSYSFSMLGNYGRLGNQMFQVAAIANLARIKNSNILLPTAETACIRKYFKIPCIDLDSENIKKINARWEEKSFSYNEIFFKLPINIDILGYFQSWKYILDEEYTRKIFQFSDEVLEQSNKIINKNNSIALHIRRTDYLKFPDTHPVQSVEYYQNALQKIWKEDNKSEPIIFTDDKEWCVSNFNNYQIVSQKEEVDMCAMSMCKHHIIANSSFSWWAAWLGKSKNQIVIAPKNWFGIKGPQDTQDLLCNEWITL